jgi:hypothetical protein
MIFKVLFFIILLISFNSCTQNKKTENEKISAIQIENNTSIENNENYKNQILGFVKNYVTYGYYVLYGDIIFLTKNENTITLQNYNRINDEEIFTEIITFNILHDNIDHEIIGESYNQMQFQQKISTIYNENIYNILYLTTVKDSLFYVDGSIEIRKKDYGLKVSTWYNLQFLSPETKGYISNFKFLSEVINEDVNKYTYDFQKQYLGTYIYDSYILFNIEPDKFNVMYEDEKIKKIISINDDGYLFLDDGFGMPFYGGGWKTKIISDDKKATLMGINPAYGTSKHLYFFAGNIIWEVDFNHDDMKYQLVFKKE